MLKMNIRWNEIIIMTTANNKKKLDRLIALERKDAFRALDGDETFESVGLYQWVLDKMNRMERD